MRQLTNDERLAMELAQRDYRPDTPLFVAGFIAGLNYTRQGQVIESLDKMTATVKEMTAIVRLENLKKSLDEILTDWRKFANHPDPANPIACAAVRECIEDLEVILANIPASPENGQNAGKTSLEALK